MFLLLQHRVWRKKKKGKIRRALVILIKNKHDIPHYGNKFLTEKDMGQG